MAKPEKYKYIHPQRVAWGDMDAYGHLNNVIYARYFESARAEYFTSNGLWKNPSRVEGGAPVVTRLEFDYRRQVVFPDSLEVTIAVTGISPRGFKMPCSIWNSEGECVATALATFLWIDFTTGRPARIPQEILKQLNEIPVV